MPVPGDAFRRPAPRAEVRPRRVSKSRILLEAYTRLEMRTIRRIAQVIIKSPGTRVGPVQNLADRCGTIGVLLHRANLREPHLQPGSIGDGPVNQIQVG